MNQEESILILLAIADNHTAYQIGKKIRDKFSQLPLEVDIVGDGKRALADFQQKSYTIVITTGELPGLTGYQLTAEIMKTNGAVPILFLSENPAAVPHSSQGISLPIVDWNDFLARVQTAIPDEWKAKFGLFERNGILYEKLVQFGKRYQNSEAISNTKILEGAFVCIPRIFEVGIDTSQFSKKTEATITETKFRELNPKSLRKALWIEIGILAILTSLSAIILMWNFPNKEDIQFLKISVVSLTIFSYFGFFLGRAFDRYILSKEISVAD